jgi:hypothetical protein
VIPFEKAPSSGHRGVRFDLFRFGVDLVLFLCSLSSSFAASISSWVMVGAATGRRTLKRKITSRRKRNQRRRSVA